jgi:hypothetical protein
VGPVVIVVVLPFAKLVIEQMDMVGDAVFVQQLVELLLVPSGVERSRSVSDTSATRLTAAVAAG